MLVGAATAAASTAVDAARGGTDEGSFGKGEGGGVIFGGDVLHDGW